MAGLDCDVVIVGAGLAGSAAARSLVGRGRQVVLLEQFELGHDRGSSHGTSRIYRRAYRDEFYVDLTGSAAAAFDELESAYGAALRHRTGGLDAGAGRDPEGLLEVMHRKGIAAELLDGPEVARRWPGIALSGPVMFHPDAGHLDAGATVEAQVRLAAAAGVEVYDETPVLGVEQTRSGPVVHTAGRSYRAEAVVLAVGGWLPVLPAGVALPSLTVKQQEVFHFRHLDPTDRWPTLIHEDGVEFYGLPSGADGGIPPAMKVAQFNSVNETTADTRDFVIDPRARTAVTTFVQQHLPGLDPRPVAEQSCLFTMTANEDFLLDRVGDIVVASACSGHGAKFAPVTGELIADLVDGKAALPRFALAAHR